MVTDPASYEAWYHTSRGRWIGDVEFDLLLKLIRPAPGETLLDVGCGTGYFSRRFAQQGLSVTGIDPDHHAIDFAQRKTSNITYLPGSALRLPFPDRAFDHSVAITSLCFIAQPQKALSEMWRITQHTLTLGLLNRRSLLHRLKQGRGRYQSARWDTAYQVMNNWIPQITHPAKNITVRTALFFPQGNKPAQWAEACLPNRIPWGGFLAINLEK